MAMYRPEHPSPPARRRRLVVLLLLAFFALQLLVFLAFRAVRPPPAPASSTAAVVSVPGPVLSRVGAEDSSCGSGLVYIYDLPAVFNQELLGLCDSLAPMYSMCPYLANDGLGFPAGGTNLSAVLPRELLGSWYASDQFALEHIVHRRLLSHRCRTTDPARAAAFFVPFYAGLAVGRHLWAANATDADRDSDCVALLSWLHAQPYYKRSHGWDHFIALGRITWDFRRTPDGGWGGSFLTMPGVANITRLVIERDPWDDMDVGIPYPTGFHPRTATDVRAWQRYVARRPRPRLFAFAGAPRSSIKGDFRALLLEECQAAGASCGALDCAEGKCIKNNALVMELFMGARFCLQPRGDSFTRRSLFDCMVAGAVPVLFWRRTAYQQYGWFLPVDGREGEWSVFIDRNQLRAGNLTVRGVLAAIPESQMRLMRKRVVKMIPTLVYSAADGDGLGGGMKDAVDVMVDGMLRRVPEHHRSWR
ncbi:xyloglucan galactosyltransferase XLT2-like [Phragmites australis]|uniref:xyloglucan galactosyltransferase XLT2-like n=1 Tax=Phragmites australis TaxID=29695 RepID=UPI002D7842A8|nr:xyloglucan galactosyltransferase XLT2-like [Phragmites australis]